MTTGSLSTARTPRLGVDLGGTKMAGSLLMPDGAVGAGRRAATPRDYDSLLREFRDLADALAPSRATPVGVGAPGSISPSSGRMRNCNLTFVNGQDLRADLETATGRRVRLANDADCFTLSEASDGAAAGARVVFGVILGTGVGGGIAVDGRLLPGAGGTAGEWGHTPLPWPDRLEAAGPRCWCGQVGCLEQWVSGPGLERDYASRFSAEPGLRAPDIVLRAEQGDPLAAAALDVYLDRLGRGLAVICNVLDPEVIVLGGGLSNLQLLYTRLPQVISGRMFTDRLAVRLARNRHGDASGVRGAAWLWPDGAPADV